MNSENNCFIALLPCKKDENILLELLGSIDHLEAFAAMKPPLHATLYFLSRPKFQAKERAVDWLKNATKFKPVSAEITGLKTFKKQGKDFVYFLALAAPALISLNNDIGKAIKNDTVDRYSFVPHLSLFFPQKKVTASEKKKIIGLFDEIKSITFDKLALICEENGVRRCLHSHNL